MIENNNSSIKLISGAYASELWDSLRDSCEEAESPENIYEVIKTLHECNKDNVAFDFVKVLHDMIGFEIPNDVLAICGNDNNRSSYIAELLSDIENMI